MRKCEKAVRQGETDSDVKVKLEITGKKRVERISAVVSEEQAEMLLEMLDRFTDFLPTV